MSLMRRPAIFLLASLAGCVITVRRFQGQDEVVAPAGAEQAASVEPLWEAVQAAEPHSELLLIGARVFDERCAVCHGDSGQGDGTLADVLGIRPRNYHQDRFLWGTSPSQIVTTVASGRSGVMPPFGEVLSEREMWAVAALVWRWIPEEARVRDTPETMLNWTLPKPAGKTVGD